MRYIFTLFILTLCLAGNLWAAQVDVKVVGDVKLNATPKQIVVTPDGNRIYVLTESGQVLIYGRDGMLQGSAEVGPNITGISPFGGNVLLLQDAVKKAMVVVSIDTISHITTDGSPTAGKTDAPVTIAVFSDFECPYCSQAAPLLEKAQAEFPDSVKLVFKSFPLSFHKHSREAATAAFAADRQGKFWEVHDLFFQNFKSLTSEKIRALVQQAGVDMSRFDKDIEDPAIQQKIDADAKEGETIGIHGTPAIYVNGHALQDRSPEGLRRVIHAELSKLKS